MLQRMKAKSLATFDLTQVFRKVRDESQWSLVTVAMMAPLSLLTLWLWSTTPTAPPLSHGARPLDMGALAWLAVFLVAWLLMTAAMMLPSAMPLLAALDRIARGQHGRHQIPFVAALAYLGVWGLVGVAAWIGNVAAESFIIPGASADLKARLAGAGLILAGLYGLSPLASACLRACRRPFGFLARYWSGTSKARLQAARIGAAYGVSCVGCCVPMIAIMFVAGMSHLAITITLGMVMVIMKSSSGGTWLARLLALMLVGAGVAIGMMWVPLGHHHH